MLTRLTQGEARKILEVDQQMGLEEEKEPLYGFLMRKTRLTWIQRWCVCSDNSLYISKSPRDHLSVTKVYLPHYSICRSKYEEHKREWVFKIWGEGKKTIFLAAQNSQSRDMWVLGLREAARSDETTPINTLTKSTIKQFASSSLSTLKGITLGRERTGSKEAKVLKSPSDTDITKHSLAAALEAEFGLQHDHSPAADDAVWLEPEKPSETIVLSGTLKKSNKRSLWDHRHYVVIGSILREYVKGTDEWPQDSIYLPGSRISSICSSTANPPYILKIEPLGKEPILLAAKTRLELNVWEQELGAISKLKPDPEILRDMDPDYVDLSEFTGEMSRSMTTQSTVSFGARIYNENPADKGKSRSLQPAHKNAVKTPTPQTRRYQRGHRRTHSDNYFNPAELRQPTAPQPRAPAKYAEVQRGGREPLPSPFKGGGSPYRDVLPPPPARPVPCLPPETPPQPPGRPSIPTRTRTSTLPPNLSRPSKPAKPAKQMSAYKPIVPPSADWPFAQVPNPLEDQEPYYNSPSNDQVFHSAENTVPHPLRRPRTPGRPSTPGKRRNRTTFVYSDSMEDFHPVPDFTADPGEPYSRFSQNQRLEGGGNTSPFAMRNPLADMEFEPSSPFNRRANTPPGTRFNRANTVEVRASVTCVIMLCDA